eukprot:Platyproteum_vivax@DN7302_c0_g1_i1.p1
MTVLACAAFDANVSWEKIGIGASPSMTVTNSTVINPTVRTVSFRSEPLDFTSVFVPYPNWATGQPVPPPKYTARNCTCSNAVQDTFWEIEYSEEKLITAVHADLVLTSITPLACDAAFSVPRRYSVRFTPPVKADENRPFMPYVVTKSGSPGYLVGTPLIAGLTEYESRAVRSKKRVKVPWDATTRVARAYWHGILPSGICRSYTLPTAPPDSYVLPLEAHVITFGVSQVFLCSVEYNKDQLQTMCEDPNPLNSTFQFLNENFDRVGVFGINDPNVVRDFQRITSQKIPNRRKWDPVASSLKYEVLYSSFGMTVAPQKRIVSAKYTWVDTDWGFTLEDAVVPQKFLLQGSISYIDQLADVNNVWSSNLPFWPLALSKAHHSINIIMLIMGLMSSIQK